MEALQKRKQSNEKHNVNAKGTKAAMRIAGNERITEKTNRSHRSQDNTKRTKSNNRNMKNSPTYGTTRTCNTVAVLLPKRG